MASFSPPRGARWGTFIATEVGHRGELAIAFLVADKPAAISLGFGSWFVPIGAIGSLVGAIRMMNEAKTRA
jgi:hypothetical protein